MANKKISELAAAVALGAPDLFEVVQDGVNVKMSGAQLLAACTSAGSSPLTGINTQSGSYTLVLADAGLCVEMSSASANILTIPPGLFPVGTSIIVRQMGVGQTTIVAGGDLPLRNPHKTDKLSAQYATVSLHQRAVDDWCVDGNFAES